MMRNQLLKEIVPLTGAAPYVVEAVEHDTRRRVLPFGRPTFAGAGRIVNEPNIVGLKLVENRL